MKSIISTKEYETGSTMFQIGVENAAICFSYIPDFSTEKEKIDFYAGFRFGKKISERTVSDDTEKSYYFDSRKKRIEND